MNQDWGKLKPILPVASGGLSPLHVPDLIENFGTDVVFQFGGGCHGHPKGTREGATAIRQAIDATLDGSTLIDYAKTHKELKLAVEIDGEIHAFQNRDGSERQKNIEQANVVFYRIKNENIEKNLPKVLEDLKYFINTTYELA